MSPSGWILQIVKSRLFSSRRIRQCLQINKFPSASFQKVSQAWPFLHLSQIVRLSFVGNQTSFRGSLFQVTKTNFMS